MLCNYVIEEINFIWKDSHFTSHGNVRSNKKKTKKNDSYLAAACAVSNPPAKSTTYNQTKTKRLAIGQKIESCKT